MNEQDFLKVLSREIVFEKGPIRVADCQLQMSKNQIISRQILEHPGSVVIIPRIAQSQYYLIRQLRYAVKEYLWEVPAGGVEEGESLEEAAKRELREEIGYAPKKIKKIASIFPSPGVSAEVMHLFLGEDLIFRPLKGDEDEVIQVKAFSGEEILNKIASGEIRDAKTIVAFYHLKINNIL